MADDLLARADWYCEDNGDPEEYALVADLATEVRRLQAELAKARDESVGWSDRACYYRNVAIAAGADPESFDDEYDRALARGSTLTTEWEGQLERELAESRKTAEAQDLAAHARRTYEDA